MIYSVAKMQDQVRTVVVTDFYTVQFVWLQILGSSLGNYLHPRNFIIFLSAIKISFLKHLTMKNCDKRFRKSTLKVC